MRSRAKQSAAALALIALLGPAAGAAPQMEGVAGASPQEPSSSTLKSTTGGAAGGLWKTTNFLTTDPTGPTVLVEAVGLEPKSFQIISAGPDAQRLSGTLKQGRTVVRSGLPLSLEGCGGTWPERWDRRATFSEAGPGPGATTVVEMRVRALDVPTCFLVARISVAKGE